MGDDIGSCLRKDIPGFLGVLCAWWKIKMKRFESLMSVNDVVFAAHKRLRDKIVSGG